MVSLGNSLQMVGFPQKGNLGVVTRPTHSIPPRSVSNADQGEARKGFQIWCQFPHSGVSECIFLLLWTSELYVESM